MPKPCMPSWWRFPPQTREVQFDEKGAFVGKKEKHCDPADPGDAEQGDQGDQVALDPEHRGGVQDPGPPDPPDPLAQRPPDPPDRSAFLSCPRRPPSRRTAPRASAGENATNSACKAWAWGPASAE